MSIVSVVSAPHAPKWVAPLVLGAARVTLGVLWLHEGIVKYRAHFGAADIGFVVSNARTDSRVPGFFRAFSDATLARAPHLFGFAMPLLETALGVALVLGVLSLTAAVGSLFTLMTYWCADQLIDQYPVMAVLSGAILLWPVAASRFSVTTLAMQRLHRVGIASVR